MVENPQENDDLALDAVFPEEERPPTPDPTITTYVRTLKQAERGNEASQHYMWDAIEVRLVGTHPLWGHYLWNAARAFANYLDANPDLYRHRNVLELGAGGGLPGLVTALNGSRKTVLTDYPDQSLIDNLSYNVGRNVPESIRSNVTVTGYVWGKPVEPLLEAVAPDKFRLIILSDLVFNHSQHDALLKTCELTLESHGTNSDAVKPAVLVFYTHHRPHLASRDMQFFEKAKSSGWKCEKVVIERYPPMFPEDPGDEEVRATVHGWKLVR
ncbi:nicotinamide N-methyltransferase [Pyrrhoderma noxium]|uniref:Protein N-terminal and lysine N-methyltransferase EFM7 n=1 Tax=Pyrrhoderma noxium TaxID=2282107 RepID=A0A286UI19_9AGAM|nr:nicotinamide N-methyltransferase [Pyrrhoderma noxium]